MNKTLSIVFTGDIGFDRYMAGKWTDEELLSQEILEFFHSADHVVPNVEGAIVDESEFSSSAEFCHYMTPEVTDFLQKIHADIWCIGNNHIMDAGIEGLNSTRRIADSLGCKTIGAGVDQEDASQPVYFDEAGGVGIFSVNYISEARELKGEPFNCCRWDNLELISKRIAEIKAKCRWCVVVVHGGEEFATMPSSYTRELYIKYLEAGADAVVGHHPHVPENYETFEDGKVIFYSLGNFIFDTDYQRAHPYTEKGALVKLCFTEEKMDFEALGYEIVRGTERLVKSDLPGIFTDIQAEDYELLIPLGAKVFLEEERRRMIYLEPENYKDLDEAGWLEYFNGKPEGYYKGQHMDLSLIVPLAEKAKEGQWRASKLEQVKAYMVEEMGMEYFVPTAQGLVDYCRRMMTTPHLYVWAAEGEYVTTEIINYFAEKYPSGYTPEKKEIRLALANRGIRGWDCFGLIKSYIFNDYHQNNTDWYIKSFDRTTTQLFEWAEEKGTIDTIPEIPGLCVWKPGHVGVYAGNGMTIESTCKWNVADTTHLVGGIQELPLEVGEWTHWLKCPYIKY